ncbi:MAG: ABC transporter ATP-binding protein [Deltaproteobacteria bacterium]|nr:ABC transporter ATP-binding protein [Deltaproteobacteria bacterium]
MPKQVIRSVKEYLIYRIKGGRYDYEEFWALRNIDIESPTGKVVGVIGRNGAGKSTLLKVLAGVIKPIEGKVEVNGRIAPLIELGAGFDPELTGRENTYLNGTILGCTNKEITQKIDQIIDFSERGEFIDAPLRTYSSGMIARLGFAIATDVDPDILIVDEILGVGDDAFQAKCKKRIENFRSKGVTILFVSHDLNQVEEICDWVYWLDHGQVRANGAPKHVVSEYRKFMTKRSVN